MNFRFHLFKSKRVIRHIDKLNENKEVIIKNICSMKNNTL